MQTETRVTDTGKVLEHKLQKVSNTGASRWADRWADQVWGNIFSNINMFDYSTNSERTFKFYENNSF